MTDTLDRYELGDRASLFLLIAMVGLGICGTGLALASVNFPQPHGPICLITRDGGEVVFTWLGGKDITFIESVEYFVNNISRGFLNNPYFSDTGRTFRYASPYPSTGKVVIHWADGPDWNLVEKIV